MTVSQEHGILLSTGRRATQASMASRTHRAKQYRSVIPGVAPMMFASNHHFPRHSHDQFGVGVIASGGQRSWSGVGTVRALAGDVIMVNPGEMHDGAPLDGAVREWRIIYLDPAVVACEADEEFVGTAEIVRPVARDPNRWRDHRCPTRRRLGSRWFPRCPSAVARRCGHRER